MADKTKCLMKLKGVLDDADYKELEQAALRGEDAEWGKLMQKAYQQVGDMREVSLLNLKRKTEVVEYINGQAEQGITPQEALLDMISGSGVRQRSGVVSLDKYIEGIKGDNLAKLADYIDKAGVRRMGAGHRGGGARAKNIVKAIFGDSDAIADPAVAGIKKAWTQTLEDLRLRFNKAGGSIAKMEDFNLPVSHDLVSIGKVSKEEWVKDAMGFFDLRFLPHAEEFAKRGKAGSQELLGKMYDNMVTEQDLPLAAAAIKGRRGATMGKSHQQHRWLQPKNGDSWMAYTQKYGKHQHPIDAMVEYVDQTATEIGLMEKFGTNPMKTFGDVVDGIKKKTGKPNAGALSVAAMDNIIPRTAASQDLASNTFRAFRNLQTATKLGMAPITALSDAAFTAVTSLYNGMNPIKVFMRQVKLLAGQSDHLTAAKHGFFTEYALSRAVAGNRFTDIENFGMLGRVADMSVRASGLNNWTNAARTAFSLEFMSTIAGKDYGSLGRGLKRAVDRYGFTPAEWDVVAKSHSKVKGVDIFDANKVADQQLRAKALGMIREEMGFAVPEPNAKARAVANWGAANNTIASEIIKTGMQFKSFGVSVMLSHAGRALDSGVGLPTRVGYGAATIGLTGAIGGVVLQLKEVARGRELRETNAEFFLDALLQGGALGVAGDVVLSNPKSFGGFASLAVGPTFGEVDFVKDIALESFKTFGDFENRITPALKAAGVGAVDMASSVLDFWYTKLALERMLLDTANRMADPAKYYKKQRRTQQWMRNERDQGYLLPPK